MDDMDKILEDILAEFGSGSVEDELGLRDLLEDKKPSERQLPSAVRNQTRTSPPRQDRARNTVQSASRAQPSSRRERPAQAKPRPEQPATRANRPKPQSAPKPTGGALAAMILARTGFILVETVLLVVFVLYSVMFILAKGPSVTARELFVRSVRETSAVGFLANIYLSDEEIAEIENVQQIEEFRETDTSLVTITKPAETDNGPVADEWGFVDEDGDGIIIDEVKGEGFSGFMMIVQDPSRVIMGSVPASYGGQGYTVQQMVERFDAVAGINAGSFYDPNGEGNGSTPDSMVVFEGEVYYAGRGVRQGFVGLDANHVLHVGMPKEADVKEWGIQYGAAFGPVLIANGEVALAEDNVGGLNPRTAIGQRSDGAILMLVIDGRQVISIGATLRDLTEIFLEYGAVNACNLDGGSSSMMWYRDGYVNNCASVIGVRPVPTTFLVLKEGAQ